MELRHLRYFLALADRLHFGRAAAALRVSQPTLSQQIQKLEGELETALFERGTRVRLTQAGELFRVYASRAVEDVRAGERAVASLRGLATGTLRVGYLPSLRGVVVPAVLAVLRRHPGLRIRTEEGVGGRVERRVADGRLGRGRGVRNRALADLETEPLFESRLGLVVGPKHRLAAGTKVQLDALGGETFALLSRGLRARTTVEAYFGANHFAPRVALESDSVATVLDVVRAGIAVTLLPEPRVTVGERLPTLRLSPEPPSQLAALVWRRAAPRSPAAVALAEELRTRTR